MQRFLYASLLTQEPTDNMFAAILNEQVAMQAAMGATIEEENHRHHTHVHH